MFAGGYLCDANQYFNVRKQDDSPRKEGGETDGRTRGW